MSSRKILSFLSTEWLGRRGDRRQLLIRYSIVDSKHFGKPDQRSHTDEHSVIVSVSGLMEDQWVQNDPRLGEDRNLEKVLFEYAKLRLKEKIKSNEIPQDEEFQINTYTDYTPPDPESIQIAIGTPQEIEAERIIGFSR